MGGGLALHQLHPFIATSHNPSQVSDFTHQVQPLVPPPSSPSQVSDPCSPSLHQTKSIEEFRQVHAQFIKLGLHRIPRHAGDLLSVCALSRWGSLNYARSIFDGLDDPDTFDYNIMIRAHVNYSDPNAAMHLYQDMVRKDVKPDNFTFPFALKACAQLSAMGEGMQVHAHVLKFGFGSDIFVQNSLINLYGKCEEIVLSLKVFQKMDSNRTVASWSAILAAHARMGFWADSVNLFSSMIDKGVRPDESSLVSVLSSCAHLGALDLGRSIHSSLMRNFTVLNVIVQTTLLDMYMKCGCLEKGLTIFDSMPHKNEWAYSVLISGLAMHGAGEKALEIFRNMLKDGIEPDGAIYVGVLSACSHAGLVEEGLQCFDQMRLEHRLEPKAQHYRCIVDLVGRAGKLDDAFTLIQNMPTGMLTDVAWRSLLSACKVHGNLELAERATRNLVELNRVKAGDYVILSSIYAKLSRWDDLARVRTEMVDRGLSQVPGFSLVEVKGRMHTFLSQDKSHPRSDEVYEMLYQMEWQLRFEGYRPDTSQVLLLDTDEQHKLKVLGGHSQKLAIAFGLLNTSTGDSIRIITNIRMSTDCHTYASLISNIFERNITFRDRNRFHCFRQGACSCQNFW